MKRVILIITAVLFVVNSYAQDSESKFDLRFGIGSSLLGTGDMLTIMVENELNIKLNNYFTLGEGLGFAKSENSDFQEASFLQLNSNIYLSPFRNNRKNNFRVGVGLSWYSISDWYRSSATYQNGKLIDSEYEFDNRNSIGINLIIEKTYSISDKLFLGLKLFSQPYQNGDINSGILVILGVKM